MLSMEPIENITISLNRYDELIQEEQKSKQYKAYCLENTHNNQLMKALVTIESKNLYQLIKENQDKEEKDV